MEQAIHARQAVGAHVAPPFLARRHLVQLLLHALGVVVIKQFGEVGAQEFQHRATQRLNDQAVFFVAEFALFNRLTQDAAVQLVVRAANQPPRHILPCNVSALLNFMHEAGECGGAPNAALFQHAHQGCLRIMRLQFAHVHAGLQFIVLYARIRNNGLKKGAIRCGVIGFGLRLQLHGDNAPARKLGAFHGVPVLAPFRRRNAGRERFPRAWRHAAFGGVSPKHAIQALFLCSHGVGHRNAMQRCHVHRLVCFLRFHHGVGRVIHCNRIHRRLFLFNHYAFLFF